ncbi:TRAP-type mannitol/chloroaromatic compound transport system substrate-binding protein [Constrictibacter sp. MBR-5]|jgi:TRAP-type mannitol/chloroaromatic compound transport system substrate-binding protein|uniref:substrate-binding domain-containing protein n=1 Tax=Constrictibacter sp. MBR-5 TaxID=3156467 RepID=UPI003394BDE2
MSDEDRKATGASAPAADATTSGEVTGKKTALNRRDYLKGAALGVAGVGAAATLGMPAIAKAQNKTWKLKLQSNWTGIGIESQDRAAKLYVERVNKLSNGRIEMTNFDAEVLLGIGETFRGVGSGVADVAVTSSVYHRGIVPVGEYLWAVPFFPFTNLEFYEYIYQFMGIKELWREAYAPHGVMHLTYQCSDEWGAMVSTKEIRKYADFKGLKVRAFGLWADWLVHNGASIVTVPGGEVYTAIQTKILDAAAFGSPDAWAGMKMHEICKYYINPSVVPYDVCEVIMNLKTFNEMPPDLQEVMLSASRVQNLDISALTIPTDARGRKVLEEGGMETIMMSDEDLKQAADWCWERLLSKKGQVPHIDKMIDIYTEAKKLHKAYYGPKRLPT